MKDEDPLEVANQKLLRAQAEIQNILRRSAREQQEVILYGNSELLLSLLDIVDDFERAIEASCATNEKLTDGIKMVYSKLAKLLTDNKVEPIETHMQSFNPVEHSAVSLEFNTEYEPGTVIHELQRGYRLRDRVLRPSKVIVASNVEPS